MRFLKSTRRKFGFVREKLPSPQKYFESEGLQFIGNGEWRTALCPFHDDHTPSFRAKYDVGCFLCMSCGARGGDVLAFHMLKYRVKFIEAAKSLGAWIGGSR